MKTKLLKQIRKQYYIMDYPDGDPRCNNEKPHFEVGINHWLFGKYIRRWLTYVDYSTELNTDKASTLKKKKYQYEYSKEYAYEKSLQALQEYVIEDNYGYGERRQKVKQEKEKPIKVWYGG